MIAMLKLSTHYVLPARTAPKILEAFKLLLWKHQTKRKIRFRGRALTGEAVLSAIVLRFLDLSESDQERVLAEYVPRFEAMLAGDDVAEKQHGEGEEAGPVGEQEPGNATVIDDRTVASRDIVPKRERPKKVEPKRKGEK
jgi:hypothetical protein